MPNIDPNSSIIVIKNGKIVNHDCIRSDADILIENGKIKEISDNIMAPTSGNVRVIDAKGLYVLPGGIDTHTHMQMPFMGTFSSDDFYTGTRAALAGGTTMIIDFVVSHRGDSLLKNYDQYRKWADEKVCCDYGLHVIVPHFDDKIAEEMGVLVRERGINSFKAFLAYRDVFMLEDDEFYDMMRECRRLGALTQVHAENGKVIEKRANEIFASGITGPEGHFYSRPTHVEVEATTRAITLAAEANCPLYVVHVMSKEAAEAISNARHRGQIVFGEPIAAGLACDASHYFYSCWRHAAGYVLSPPLRLPQDNGNFLINMLASGELECTGTDHCVFRSDQKALGKDDFRKIPNGINGVEDRMSIVWEKGVMSGSFDTCKFVAVTSANAAKVFNIYPRKGCIAVGSDADLVIWNGEECRTITQESDHQNVDFNIFEGMKVHGVPHLVMTGGRVVLDKLENKTFFTVTKGSGSFIPTPAFSPHVYGHNAIREELRNGLSGVKREPYLGPVVDVSKKGDEATLSKSDGSGGTDEEFHCRPVTCGGTRNMQDSSFSFSGSQMDEKQGNKSSIKTFHPPGGKSSGIW